MMIPDRQYRHRGAKGRMDDERAIIRVLTEYGLAIDRRDWPLFRNCFIANVAADYGDIGRWASADTLAAWMAMAHERYGATLHRIGNFVIDINETRATATSYVDAVLAEASGTHYRNAIGSYDDELLLEEAGWRIARRTFRLAVLRVVEI